MYNIGRVTAVRNFEAANELLGDGWILLAIEGSPDGALSQQLFTLGLRRTGDPIME